MTDRKYTGETKWFDSNKGYGFIKPDAGGKDVFVHITALERAGLANLKEGERVEFELEENRGRQCAANIRKAA